MRNFTTSQLAFQRRRAINDAELLADGGKLVEKYLENGISRLELQVTKEQAIEAKALMSEELSHYNKQLDHVFDISTNTYNVLAHHDLLQIGKLVNSHENEVLCLKRLGPKSFEEIKNCLAKLGLELKPERPRKIAWAAIIGE